MYRNATRGHAPEIRFRKRTSLYRSIMAVNGVGRPSKGPRDAIMAKPADSFGKILRENSQRLGYESYGDYIVALAAQALGMPEYAPHPHRARPDRLSPSQEANQTTA